jgi:nitroreductase
MLTTKEAIDIRRSIRSFKTDPIPNEYFNELLNAARLAPSGCNAQPWRFKIVTEQAAKSEIAYAAYNQTFISRAPAVIVCCADINGYLEGTVSGIQDLGKIGAAENRIVDILLKRADQLKLYSIEQLGPQIAFNVAIAIEHIVLRALDFGLGTCWIRLFDVNKIRELFRWEENILPVTLLPIGYPTENPGPHRNFLGHFPDIILSEKEEVCSRKKECLVAMPGPRREFPREPRGRAEWARQRAAGQPPVSLMQSCVYFEDNRLMRLPGNIASAFMI